MDYDFDLIVIGSGAGGGTLASACATRGKRVLVIERGRRTQIDEQVHDEQRTLFDKQPYDDRPIELNGESRRLLMGGVLGGGTSLYGGAMIRPSVDDFHPGKSYGERIDRALWDWPLGYDELAEYYDQAERLYHVAARGGDDFAPLAPPTASNEDEILPLADINRRLIDANRRQGLHPFQLPLSIDASLCLRCDNCAGFPCPTGARRSAAQLVDEAQAATSQLTLLTNCEVERFESGTSEVLGGVHVRERATGELSLYRARRYVLSAGAIGSPAILLRSGFVHPLIGRHYMMHYSPLCVGFYLASTGADETFVKQVGFADYYFGTDDCPHKMGLVQSLPAPGPLMMAKSGGRLLPRWLLASLRKRMLPLVGIVEDLPNPANRVTLGEGGRICLSHQFSEYDRDRGRALGRQMKRILRRGGAVYCAGNALPSQEHVAHQCGTLRFGRRADEAVVDADCRMFGQKDLFVVDGSILPTSLGVGPSLTISAMALRVADILTQEI